MKFDIMSLEAQTREMNAAIKRLRSEYRERIKVSFHEATKSFFELTPSVKMLEWTQYTPHWNDGEECTFDVNDVWYYLQNQDPDDYSYGEEAGFGDIANISRLEEQLAVLEAVLAGTKVLSENELCTYSYRDIRDGGEYNYRTGSTSPAFLNLNKLSSRIAVLKKELEETREEAKFYTTIDQDLKNIAAIRGFIGGIDASAMKDMFGNHVIVRVTAEGVKVDEYEHE